MTGSNQNKEGILNCGQGRVVFSCPKFLRIFILEKRGKYSCPGLCWGERGSELPSEINYLLQDSTNLTRSFHFSRVPKLHPSYQKGVPASIIGKCAKYTSGELTKTWQELCLFTYRILRDGKCFKIPCFPRYGFGAQNLCTSPWK